MASSQFASWCDARRFGFGLRVCPVIRCQCADGGMVCRSPFLRWTRSSWRGQALVTSDVHPHYPISHSRRDLWDPNDKPFAWSNWDGSFG